jgi:hypothetical protein
VAGDIKWLPCFLFLVINHSCKNRILPLCQVIHGNLITQFEFEFGSFVPSMRHQRLCIRWTPEQWAKKVSVLFTVVVVAIFHSSYPRTHAFFPIRQACAKLMFKTLVPQKNYLSSQLREDQCTLWWQKDVSHCFDPEVCPRSSAMHPLFTYQISQPPPFHEVECNAQKLKKLNITAWKTYCTCILVT